MATVNPGAEILKCLNSVHIKMILAVMLEMKFLIFFQFRVFCG